MKANESNFGFMKNESVIEIPFFQRAYVWGQDEWQQLYDDLLDSFNTKKRAFFRLYYFEATFNTSWGRFA